MKAVKHRMLMLILALVFAMTGIVAAVGAPKKASALNANVSKVYYFTNTFPYFDKDTLGKIYPGDIYYDMRYDLTPEKLNCIINYWNDTGISIEEKEKAMEKFFEDKDLDSETVFIFDIKGIDMDYGQDLLFYLFSYIKDRGCPLVMLSYYDEGMYEYRVIELVDKFMHCTSNRFDAFIENVVKDIGGRINDCNKIYNNSNNIIILDGRLLAMKSYDVEYDSSIFDLYLYEHDTYSLIENSYFLRGFIYALLNAMKSDVPVGYDFLPQALQELINNHISLVVYYNYEYIEITPDDNYVLGETLWTFYGDGESAIQEIEQIHKDNIAYNVFAVGICELEDYFYDFLWNCQHSDIDEEGSFNATHLYDLLVYVWEYDPLPPSDPRGLYVITNHDLEQNTLDPEEYLEMLVELEEFLGSLMG